MGCCLSSNNTSQKNPSQPDVPVTVSHHNHHHFQGKTPAPELVPNPVGNSHFNAPPPPGPQIVEEETVKEVLSETPISRPLTPSMAVEEKSHLPVKVEAEAKELSEAASQMSESCDISESFSYLSTTTTTTITEVREEDEAMSKRKREVGPRVNGAVPNVRRKRPNSGELVGRKERGPVNPASRAERSAEKRNRIDKRAVRGRESGQMRTMQRNVGNAGVRRDIGEVSSRRSRSPATRAEGGVSRGGVGRTPSKGTGRTGGRSMGTAAGEENKGMNEETNDGCPPPGNESLENPLVSLECFIFV
ncbi:hypothetical protein UlMin_014373 [Ulmus minor]